MDSTDALEVIRGLALDLATDPYHQSTDQVLALTDQLGELDAYLTNGGFIPGQWSAASHTLGKPRRLHDGVVLDVTHGTRASYNRGCRCLECTKANRDGHRRYIQSTKETTKESAHGNA